MAKKTTIIRVTKKTHKQLELLKLENNKTFDQVLNDLIRKSKRKDNNWFNL